MLFAFKLLDRRNVNALSQDDLEYLVEFATPGKLQNYLSANAAERQLSDTQSSFHVNSAL